jgi:cytochrome b6-f complex iron-sulfur subunit
MKRRDMVQKILVGGTVLLVVPSVLESCTKIPATDPGSNPNGTPGFPITVDLSSSLYASLNTTGKSVIFQNVLIINAGNAFIALSDICTHQGCSVNYDSVSGNIICPCHGSQFTISGSVVNGPATIPLQSYHVAKSGTILTITA